MKLNKQSLASIKTAEAGLLPDQEIFALPEKVLQFGTGVLLRGLPDYFIDKANRLGIFNGRIVVVKSTTTGSADAFDEQDGLYTLLVRGIENNNTIEEDVVISSISRVINAAKAWDEVLQCAENPEMDIIISNTTEAGIVLDENDSLDSNPPNTFPGKLLSFLYHRYRHFKGNPQMGMVVLPTELISSNGDKLKEIVLKLAAIHRLEAGFTGWLDDHNHFCNTLVDRIVPGKPSAEVIAEITARYGYEDELMIMAEAFRLWAIEIKDDAIKQRLSFAETDEGVVLTEDIEQFKELKLRLLNATHSLSCALALQAGHVLVKESLANEGMKTYMEELMRDEIVPSIAREGFIDKAYAEAFAAKVLDRFRNPYLDHAWHSISAQYSLKVKQRIIPLVKAYLQRFGQPPSKMVKGLAAYLRFMDVEEKEGKYYSRLNKDGLLVTDDMAERVHGHYQKAANAEALVKSILGDEKIWDEDLTKLNGLEAALLQEVSKTKEKMKGKILKIHELDNVIVALQNIGRGEQIQVAGQVIDIREDIPAKHKFFIRDMHAGDEIFMYGVVVGKAQFDVAAGTRMSTENAKHAIEPYGYRPFDYKWSPPDVSKFAGLTFNGYHRQDGKVGTANYWLFIPTVFCENRNLDVIKEALQNELGYAVSDQYKQYARSLKDAFLNQENLDAVEFTHLSPSRPESRVFHNVDGIKFLNHQGGCGGIRQDAAILSKLLAAYSNHPNVGGITVMSLGCQNLQVNDYLEDLKAIAPNFNKPLYIFEQQQSKSEPELIAEAIKKTFEGLQEINKLERKPAPLSQLTIGVKCGGSDGFSGISANPAVGYASDIFVALGAKVLLAEFPELCGVEQQLMDRCEREEDARKFMDLMKSYEAIVISSGSGFHMNPSPGNIKDGLITDAMKSAGAAKKGGTAPIVDVLDYTEEATRPGLSLVCTPGNDVEATTGKAASGATLILFTTGLGTPTGNPVCPVIKLSTNNALTERMSDIIDINCGPVITGEKSLEEMGEEIVYYCIQAASGEVIPAAVRLNQDDFIPWKRGTSL